MTLPHLDEPLDPAKRCIDILTEADRTVRDATPRPIGCAAGSGAALSCAARAAGLQVP